MKLNHHWPSGPELLNTTQIHEQVAEQIKSCSALPWQNPSFGYPGTCPLEIALTVYQSVAATNSNSIGDHSLPFFPETHQDDTQRSERGFLGTQKMEREAIRMLVRLCGGDDRQVAGYFCEGGTSANLAGMWMGRNFLRAKTRGENMLLVTTPLSHYSILKNANILGIPKKDIRYVGCTEDGQLDIDQLKALFCHERQADGFLLVLTAGSTMMGSVDDIRAVNKARKESGKATYLHVDAAFGGLVLPFLATPRPFGFDCGADSVTVDPHKMGGLPFGCGAILYRKRFSGYVTTTAEYLNSEKDWTINGSRSAANGAALWAVFSHHGYDGLSQRVQKCIELRDYAIEQLTMLSYLEVSVGVTNQLCLFLPDDNVRTDIIKQRVEGDPFHMHMVMLPRDLTNPRSKAMKPALKMFFMPHHTKEHVDMLVRELTL